MADPIGQAILDYQQTKVSKNILVECDVIDDDVIPSSYLFRRYSEMPLIEKVALDFSKGKILDVGAGSGIHALYLNEIGKQAEAIDISPGAVKHMLSSGISARLIDFMELENEKFDTLLFLMNGSGIFGTVDGLKEGLLHAKNLLTQDGSILMDSTDILYVYQEEDGSVWVDLNGSYYGEVSFRMRYNNEQGDWFPWLYIDPQKLNDICVECGLKMEILTEEDGQYLASMKRI